MVVCAAKSRRTPPLAVGRGSSPPTTRQVGGCSFETPWSKFSSSVARAARVSSRGEPADCSQSTHCALQTWRGCLRGQLAMRSYPTPLAEAPLHRHRAGTAVAASGRRNRSFLVPSRAARAHVAPWRTSRPPTEHALRAAGLARLSSRPARDALHPTPLAEALLHRHRAKSAGAALVRCTIVTEAFYSVGAARARFVTWRTSRPPTEHVRAVDLARLSSHPIRDAPHLTPLAEAPFHRRRARSAVAASQRRHRNFVVPWRAARTRVAPWKTSRPPIGGFSSLSK